MDTWVWMLIAFVGGIVVAAIISLIFRKDPTEELEQVADERGAQLSKAEMKAAVLQDKLLEAEAAQEESRQNLEAQCQENLAEAEAEYQRKFDLLEKQFDDLEAAFVAQRAAEEEARNEAAAVAAGLAVASAAAEDDPALDDDTFGAGMYDALDEAFAGDPLLDDEQIAAGDLPEEVAQAESQEQLDAALLAASVGAGALLSSDDDATAEAAAATQIEDQEALETWEAFAAGLGPDAGEDAYDAGAETGEESRTGEQADVEDDDGTSVIVKAALAAAGATMVAAAARDEEPKEEPADAEIDGAAEAAVAAAAADSPADALEVDVYEQQENGTILAAAFVSGTTAVLAASADDESETAVAPSALNEDGAVSLDELQELDELDEQDVEQGLAELDMLDERASSEQDLPIAETMLAGAAALGAEEKDDTQEESDIEVLEPEVPQPEPEPEPEPEPTEPPWPEDTSTWQGAYFNNMKLEGEPVFEREDAEIDFDWGLGSPAPEVNVDGFSARWTRTANLRPGLYRFTVTSDDGVRLWVNDRLVISAWYDHTEMTFRREMELPGGLVELRLEYYDNEMAAQVRVSWERIG